MFVVVVIRWFVVADWLGWTFNKSMGKSGSAVFDMMVWIQWRCILLPVFRPMKSTQQPYPNYLPFPHVDIPKRKSLEHNLSLQMSASETNRFQSDFVDKDFLKNPFPECLA